MHKYLERLEKRIEYTKFGKILFNKYYDLKDLYWAILYTIAFSVLAGVGNAFPEINSGIRNVIFLFVQGFVNNTYLAIIVNLFFTKIINSLKNMKYFRLFGNFFTAIVEFGFLIWHFFIGTENPLQTMTLIVILAFILVNYHISAVIKK